jgi:ATP-dependent DNA ligase
MTPAVLPQLLANDGVRALRPAIADPERFACEPKVDGVHGLLVFDGDDLALHDRRAERRDWLRGDTFEAGLRRLTAKLPILTRGTVLDGELTMGRFGTTMSALMESKRWRPDLRFVVFDVPVLAGRRPSRSCLAGTPRTARATRASLRCPAGAVAAGRAARRPGRCHA